MGSAVAILSLVPYVTSSPLIHLPGHSPVLVVGVETPFLCVEGGRCRRLYAVFEEMDCEMSDEAVIEIARRASIEAFGRDVVGMIVRTKKGFHIYTCLTASSFLESLLLAARLRNHLPATCRDVKHLELALEAYQRLGFERFVLRISPTKYDWEELRAIYRRRCGDPCAEAFIAEVEKHLASPATRGRNEMRAHGR